MATTVIREGDPGGPAVLVLDPGEVEQRELPRTWRRMTVERQVVWCRLAAPHALAEAERLLTDPDALGRPIDVVTGGAVPEAVRQALGRHPGPVRSLLLVDPADGDDEREIDGVQVRVVTRGARPRSLAEPEVAESVTSAIAEVDAGGSGPPAH
ncbi:hypothetical protein [Qaidamihabitans albus]|uniref:hypothetical protein n=1 Tax=Qaidamihabitans albus TaxID=2795733 RepID=UPI0018F25CA0|nr:hypothetical protein [Qaidamihabitans albus]